MDKIAKFKLALMKRKYSLSTIESYTGCLNVLVRNFGEYPTIRQLEGFPD